MIDKKNIKEPNEEVYDIIKSLVKGSFSISSLKNKDNFNRHMVFCITDSNNYKYVMKIFNSYVKWNNEIKALTLLNDQNIKIPKLINYNSQDRINYAFVNYIKGEQLSDIFDNLNKTEQNDIINELGIELAKIHSIAQFNTFSQWDVKNNEVYFDTVLRRLDKYKKVFISKENENLAVINAAVDEVKENKEAFMKVKSGSLCHKDFQPRNFIIDGNKKLGAIIDFESSVPGCRADDFCILYNKLLGKRSDLKKSFIDGYAKHYMIDKDFEKLIRLHLILEGMKICTFKYANLDPDNKLYESGLNLIKEQLK